MDESVTILIRTLVSNPSISYKLRRKVLNALDPDVMAIWWGTGDFEGQAEHYEEQEGAEVGSVYDRSKFQDALESMVANHDADGGINWYTVDVYLEDCRFEK